MKNYLHKYHIDERGYTEMPMTLYHGDYMRKWTFVDRFLCSTLIMAKCGYDYAEYKVMQSKQCGTTEFLVIWSDYKNQTGSRWINVTGDSLGAMICDMCDNMW